MIPGLNISAAYDVQLISMKRVAMHKEKRRVLSFSQVLEVTNNICVNA